MTSLKCVSIRLSFVSWFCYFKVGELWFLSKVGEWVFTKIGELGTAEVKTDCLQFIIPFSFMFEYDKRNSFRCAHHCFMWGWNQLTFQMWKCIWPYSFLCEFNCFSIDSMLIADVAAFHHRNFIQRIPWNKKSNEFQKTQKCHISKACKDRNQREKK